jgi:hypothetical protein
LALLNRGRGLRRISHGSGGKKKPRLQVSRGPSAPDHFLANSQRD